MNEKRAATTIQRRKVPLLLPLLPTFDVCLRFFATKDKLKVDLKEFYAIKAKASGSGG